MRAQKTKPTSPSCTTMQPTAGLGSVWPTPRCASSKACRMKAASASGSAVAPADSGAAADAAAGVGIQHLVNHRRSEAAILERPHVSRSDAAWSPQDCKGGGPRGETHFADVPQLPHEAGTFAWSGGIACQESCRAAVGALPQNFGDTTLPCTAPYFSCEDSSG